MTDWRRRLLRRFNSGLSAVLRRTMRTGAARGLPPPLDRACRRVLLVKLVGMGDAVLIRSLAGHLQQQLPKVEIGVLGGPATHEVLALNSGFKVHRYDPSGADRGLRAAWAKIHELRAQSYDAVIDFEQHIVLVAVFLRLTGIANRVGLAAADNPRTRFQTHTVPLSGADSMWDAYRALIRVVAPSVGESSALPLPSSAAVDQEIARWWGAHGLDGARCVTALHLGSGLRAAARRWPIERFVQLADRLRLAGHADAVILTGTPAETTLVAAFVAAFRGHAVDATGLGSVGRTAEVLRRCHLAISNDTGVMHLAAAMGTPTVGLFGPNSPARYAPVGPRACAVYTTHVPCSPCIHVHRGVVPECVHPERGRCLLDIDVHTVLRAAIQLLSVVR